MVVCYWMGSWNKIVLFDSISEDRDPSALWRVALPITYIALIIYLTE